MDLHHDVIAQIDGLFNSRSVAIVGVPREMKRWTVDGGRWTVDGGRWKKKIFSSEICQ
jgi:hypothetical protein